MGEKKFEGGEPEVGRNATTPVLMLRMGSITENTMLPIKEGGLETG